MSISPISSTDNSKMNLVAQLLISMLALQGGQNTNNANNIFGGIQGYPDVLGSNNVLGADSIFNTGTASSTNYSGIDTLNLQSLTSASEEKMMSDFYSSSVNSVLNTKIPTAKKG